MKRKKYLLYLSHIIIFAIFATQVYAATEGETGCSAGSSDCEDADRQLYCYTCSDIDFSATTSVCKSLGLIVGDTYWQHSQYCSNTNRQCSGGSCITICGDGICGTYETAANCPNDDDGCPAICGDNVCSSGEDSYCPQDCGGSYCGDGTCDSGETDTSCSQDCSYCGGGYCSNGQTCVDAATQTCCTTGQYFCNGGCSATQCVLPECTEGPIPSSGCICQGLNKFEGNCCYSYLLNQLMWSGDKPCTQTCTSIGGVCCSGAISDCTQWSNQWGVDCQGYTCCTGTCTGTIYHPETPTCSAQGGNICSSSQTCIGTRVGSGDSSSCCLGTCNPPNNDLSCSQLNGIICTTGQQCSGTILSNASDSNSCCLGSCTSPTTTGPYCGDGTCTPNNETISNCPNDCSVAQTGNTSQTTTATDSSAATTQVAVTQCPTVQSLNEQKELCKLEDKEPVRKIKQGCTVIECMTKEEAKDFCQKNLTDEDIGSCSGEPTIRRDANGCIVFFDCLMRGDESAIDYGTVFGVPEEAKILSVVLKMEKLKIQFNKLQTDLEKIGDYYSSIGEEKEADKFYRAAIMIESTQEKIEAIKSELRDKLGELTVQDITTAKKDLKYITKVIFRDILYIILGEEETGQATNLTEEGILDCGDDRKCFEEQLRVCGSAKVVSSGTTITIEKLKEKKCRIIGEGQGKEMECKIKDYAFTKLDIAMLQYCKGSLVDFLQEQWTLNETTTPLVNETSAPVNETSAPVNETAILPVNETTALNSTFTNETNLTGLGAV